MKNKNNILMALGFFLFVSGGLATILSLVGIKLIYMVWADVFGIGWGVIIKVVTMIAGVVIAMTARTLQEAEAEERRARK